ncbi:S1 RNA-binding domain-containing protein, partial [Myxococcota bacterium]|nr:S1 RNA-binding domain-containing protein [Myxococcota bacterium]
TGKPIQQVIGDESVLRSLRPERFTDAQFGLPTVKDILAELEKPGRDPRPSFKAAKFLDGVEKVEDLKPGMRLEGVVTNVTNFGAFVDVGVHQDGLVHISQLADRFVKDPYEVVKAGDIVQVRVVEVDLPRKRIALTMRSDAGAAQSQQRPGQGQGSGPRPQGGGPRPGPGGQQRQPPPPPQPKKKEEPFNDAFKALLEQRRR